MCSGISLEAWEQQRELDDFTPDHLCWKYSFYYDNETKPIVPGSESASTSTEHYILIPGKGLEEHLMLLDEELTRLKDANMTVNLRKCRFVTEEVSFQGFVINSHGCSKDTSQVTMIQKIPTPNSVKSLQRILELFNWCAKFVLDYVRKAAPLYDLLKKVERWECNAEHDTSFNTIKLEISKQILLVHPDMTKTSA